MEKGEKFPTRTSEDVAVLAKETGEGKEKRGRGPWTAELCRAIWGPAKEGRGCGIWSAICLRPVRWEGTVLRQGSAEWRVCW